MRHSGSTASSLGMVMLDMPMYRASPAPASSSHWAHTFMNSCTRKGRESGVPGVAGTAGRMIIGKGPMHQIEVQIILPQIL